MLKKELDSAGIVRDDACLQQLLLDLRDSVKILDQHKIAAGLIELRVQDRAAVR